MYRGILEGARVAVLRSRSLRPKEHGSACLRVAARLSSARAYSHLPASCALRMSGSFLGLGVTRQLQRLALEASSGTSQLQGLVLAPRRTSASHLAHGAWQCSASAEVNSELHTQIHTQQEACSMYFPPGLGSRIGCAKSLLSRRLMRFLQQTRGSYIQMCQ